MHFCSGAETMLCTILIKAGITNNSGNKYLFDVPDALFMRHVMMYGEFKPEQLSDGEMYSCTLVGLRDTMKYAGHAELPTEGRDT